MCELRKLIGQGLVVGIRGSGPDSVDFQVDLAACAQAHVGGVILFDHDLATGGDRNIVSPSQLRELTACLREALGDGLLIMIDQEGGAVARLRAERGFDPGLCASEYALLDVQRQRDIAQGQANQLRGLGINVNLAPVVDLAFDGQSGVIAGQGRSMGNEPDRIVRCARVWIEEHRAAGIISCLKHFPGHGSASGDSHEGLVDLSGRGKRSLELEPYRELIEERGVMVMTGHLLEREIDPEYPASLSSAHADGSLRTGIGFDGVVVTDSIDMRAISSRWSSGEAAALAIGAGADLVMDGVNASGQPRECPAMQMSDAILAAIESGQISHGKERLLATAARLGKLRDQVSRP